MDQHHHTLGPQHTAQGTQHTIMCTTKRHNIAPRAMGASSRTKEGEEEEEEEEKELDVCL